MPHLFFNSKATLLTSRGEAKYATLFACVPSCFWRLLVGGWRLSHCQTLSRQAELLQPKRNSIGYLNWGGSDSVAGLLVIFFPSAFLVLPLFFSSILWTDSLVSYEIMPGNSFVSLGLFFKGFLLSLAVGHLDIALVFLCQVFIDKQVDILWNHAMGQLCWSWCVCVGNSSLVHFQFYKQFAMSYFSITLVSFSELPVCE